MKLNIQLPALIYMYGTDGHTTLMSIYERI
jgi:hypothetical protein